MSLFMPTGSGKKIKIKTNAIYCADPIDIWVTSTWTFPKSKKSMYYVMNQDGYYIGQQFYVKNLVTGWQSGYLGPYVDFFLINTYYHDHELVSYHIGPHYIAEIEFEEIKPLTIIYQGKELDLYDTKIYGGIYDIVDDLKEWDAVACVYDACPFGFYNKKEGKYLHYANGYLNAHGVFMAIDDKFKEQIDSVNLAVPSNTAEWFQNVTLIRF